MNRTFVTICFVLFIFKMVSILILWVYKMKYFNSSMTFYHQTGNFTTSFLFSNPLPYYDRTNAQMTFTLPNDNTNSKKRAFKTILINNLIYLKPPKENQHIFLKTKCSVNSCLVTYNKSKSQTADAILFYDVNSVNEKLKPLNQIWMFMTMECPYNSASVKQLKNYINWTITYRPDSTIPYKYGRFVPFKESIINKNISQNYAAGKTKKVAWFVSNCNPSNARNEYADKLSNFIQVDIYGRCGDKHCGRNKHQNCLEMLKKDYKFYLAFENSNCRYYITEKLYTNALTSDVIPIVMGAHPDDYRALAPKHSYIHYEDFKSVKELADYLHKLDRNDTLYNEYFKWKETGTISMNVDLWCRVCAMLHASDYHKSIWYENLADWWRGKDVCIGKKRWT